MKQETITKNLRNCSSDDNEDVVVIELLERLRDMPLEYLEVGSGLCRFPKKISKLFNNIHISCVEINENLASIARQEGYSVSNCNILDNNIPSESYDVVQCSHVIEHFAYPQVIKVIDELLRFTKKDGYLIIRTPLLWKMFYYDIDHIRPYPPQCILNYLYNEQQQVVGKNKVKVETIWYRTEPKEYSVIERDSLIYCLRPLRDILNKLLSKINKYNIKLWNKYRWPSSKPNGYVMILRKLS